MSDPPSNPPPDDTGDPGDSGEASCPIVALGASAGGLEALEEFFDATPDETGAAFVVITHQHAGKPSLLGELLARRTNMAVVEVHEPAVVLPDHVYLPRPGDLLSIEDDRLVPVHGDGPELPIDHFFDSLAEARGKRAVAVVLSGTGSDGALGVKKVKAGLGMVVAQQESSARYAGMPHAAVETELVDVVLPPGEMPEPILAYLGHPDDRTHGERGELPMSPGEVQQLLELLRDRTGHDFTLYKRSTVVRRVERRMRLHRLRSVRQYTEYLRKTPREGEALFHELLIGVTAFFREPEAFDALATALEAMLRERPAGHAVRAWVPGCSTGEEAYSLAILLCECAEKLEIAPRFQIFATDLDAVAVEHARRGVYPSGISGDVPPRRLKRFFEPDGDVFVVRREIRERIVFAPQDLLRDPPFTRVDVLSCRNLFIYLDGSLQQRLLPVFHYCLNPGGLLFLGTSESVGGHGELFETVDSKWKVFRRREVPQGSYGVGLPMRAPDSTPLLPIAPRSRRGHESRSEKAVDRLLLEQLLPPTVLVRESGDIVHIHGRTGAFLEPAPGAQEHTNLLNMARDGLAFELASTLRQIALGTDAELVRHDVPMKSNGGDGSLVDFRIRRVNEPEAFRGTFLVSFLGKRPTVDEAGPDEDVQRAGADSSELQRLRDELRYAKRSHQRTVEELETTNEELQSANEELQSTNEELQSTNEELETSREELQSLNEELRTVNTELERKVEELSLARDDLKNLLNGTEIATVFLDLELRIKRFTEPTQRLLPLIPSDVGRPLGDIVSRLRYDRLFADAKEVLETLVFKEVEVRGEGDAWYLMRILPYRTTENVIDGLVLTFVDISNVKALQQRERRFIEALKDAPTTVAFQDAGLKYVWTSGVLFGRPPDHVVGRTDGELLGEDQATALLALKREVLATKQPGRGRFPIAHHGRETLFDVFVELATDEGGRESGVSCVCTDLGSPDLA
ncbi:MAG: CheR family methyltransferase [Myxococcales bacterium]|jgi:two-component system CheB/CheR fusion protein